MEERSKIEILHQEGYPISQGAKRLNCQCSSFYRELGRCISGAYKASSAAECIVLISCTV
ncbi:helix-turn-helix domain-containing protein [Facklamia lactis]|uniref:helix-turn-helix domain-containing protein n=1 Tax=Facklamia lactis TaxID=2749967 RepID=UPI0034DD5208